LPLRICTLNAPVRALMIAGMGTKMTSVADENTDKTHRYYQALWNERDVAVIPDWIASDYIGHFTSRPDVHGPAGFRSFADELFTAFPDLHMSIEDVIARDDHVVSRVRLTGTHLGPMQGYAPTGLRVSTTFVAIERYANGLCVEEWVYVDDLGLARQVGALPLPGSAAERVAQWAHRAYAWRSRRRNHGVVPRSEER
jgi:predicted ester cyclase